MKYLWSDFLCLKRLQLMIRQSQVNNYINLIRKLSRVNPGDSEKMKRPIGVGSKANLKNICIRKRLTLASEQLNKTCSQLETQKGVDHYVAKVVKDAEIFRMKNTYRVCKHPSLIFDSRDELQNRKNTNYNTLHYAEPQTRKVQKIVNFSLAKAQPDQMRGLVGYKRRCNSFNSQTANMKKTKHTSFMNTLGEYRSATLPARHRNLEKQHLRLRIQQHDPLTSFADQQLQKPIRSFQNTLPVQGSLLQSQKNISLAESIGQVLKKTVHVLEKKQSHQGKEFPQEKEYLHGRRRLLRKAQASTQLQFRMEGWEQDSNRSTEGKDNPMIW